MYYIKATLKGGKSKNKPEIVYPSRGMVVHPNPNKETRESCGIGIHLSKSLSKAREYVRDAKEFYFARPGVILGEDDFKVRCSSCYIIKRLTDEDIAKITRYELSLEEVRIQERELTNRFGIFYSNGCLPGKDWLLKHADDVSQKDIDSQVMVILKEGKKVSTVPAGVTKKESRELINMGMKWAMNESK